MKRKQLYNEITSLGLQEEVKKKFGKNYTQCTNDQLNMIIDSVVKTVIPVSTKGKSAFNKLVEILAKKKILLKSEVESIMNA